MKTTTANSFEEVKEIVEKWWSTLQFERKCNRTNAVHQIVNNSNEEIQEQVRILISEEIKNVIEKCRESKDVNDMQNACNAINGCFDNFIHAIDAARLLFVELVSFIDFGLTQCQSQLHLRTNQRNSALELLYSLSRILILVLKLKRTQNVGKKNHTNIGLEDFPNSQHVKQLLSNLSYKIGRFIMMDDILIDTKNNFSMAGILIREILVVNEEELIQFHRNFLKTIPESLLEENYKLNILKFLTSSAIINTWSVNIIDTDAVYTYLRFFILLCEKYSSETPVILNTSRTLLLLIRHESFKQFLSSVHQEVIEETMSMLLTCIFMLLEHPVACVRHSARDFLQLLAGNPSLQSVMLDSIFKLPTDKRSYFISLGALANEVGTRALIERKTNLPEELFAALSDPTIVSHVSLALEFIILNDSLAEYNFSEWCETWIVPLLVSLINVLPIVAADIDKLLEKAFKKYPKSVVYVTDKWAHPTSGEELRYVITALKISHKQGFKVKSNISNKLMENDDDCKGKNNLDKERMLISESLLEHCLHQKDDDIRISAFSLLVEAHKTTKPYSERDFKLILYFLRYNLNNQQPATRQKILGLVQKMLVRFADSRTTLLRKNTQQENSKSCVVYEEFLDSLVSFCFSNIFVGCNFNRLNTVLNILLFCFEHIKDMRFKPDKTNAYWKKLLIALDSSYEENKEIAVVLSRKLDFALLDASKPEAARLLYEKAFNLCSHMEPPDVLTGAYLLQTLIKLPSSKEVLTKHFIKNQIVDDVDYYCIQILVQKLREQIQLAKLDLMTAATCGPMYGSLFAIRLIFKNVNFSRGIEQSVLAEWGKIINDLIEMCFDVTSIVGCVVNSSSPEGHLPMDFQTDFENLLSENFAQSCHIKSSEGGSEAGRRFHLIQAICENFFQKFNNLELIIESPQRDSYESLRSLKALLKENELLIQKMSVFSERNAESNESRKETTGLWEKLSDVKSKIENHVEKLEKTNTVIDWPATAQVLLLCAWRSIKESSLYLGDLVAKLPIETEIELGLLTKDKIVRIGEELRMLLCEIKHRGAFEHAYIGFTQLVNSLWKCSDKNLSNLPKMWLEEITGQLELAPEDQKMKLCSTRRSAGLPFLVQAIVCSEIVSVKSTIPSSLHTTIKSLLGIIEDGVVENVESKIHALNVLRALFKHARLGEYVASYVSRALMVAIRGSRAATWSERNSSSLLFSSLIIRIFGVARSRDEISKKNRMTSRTFFQRYSELYDFLLSEMELVYSKENYVDGLYPRPSLYLVLLILGRLYPPPTEDPENIDLSEFLPYINMSRRNPTMKIRELGARALVPLIPLDRLLDELSHRFSILSSKSGISQNERHGVLLQVKELLTQSSEGLKNLSNGIVPWVEDTKWMLSCHNQISLITLSTYVKVLHILFKNFDTLRESIKELITSSRLAEDLLKANSSERGVLPGIFVFLENFYFLKTDILAQKSLDSSEFDEWNEEFFKLFLFMLKCGVGEVQSIPLRILCFVLAENPDYGVEFDDEDFSGIGVDLSDLLIFQSEERVRKMEKKIVSNPEVLKFLVDQLNRENQDLFKSKVVHRALLSAVSTLVMSDVIPLSHSSDWDGSSLRIDFAKSRIRSRDKDLSTNSLICYAIYLMEEASIKKRQGMSPEDRSLLSDILSEFSSFDADVKERLAVAKILNRCSRSFTEKNLISDPLILGIWMIPFKLIADEDPGVRLVASELVHKMQEHIVGKIPSEELLIKMKTLDWPHLPLVSLKAWECLLDSYINILGTEYIAFLVVQMVIVAVSSLRDLDDLDNYAKDEFGVFEKGNPNPYCEELALSDLMCQKLTELRSIINWESLMWDSLDEGLSEFIAGSFHMTDFEPRNLMEVVETLTAVVEDTERLNGEFSMTRLQVRRLRKAVGLLEIV